jgi:hypothetical protein
VVSDNCTKASNDEAINTFIDNKRFKLMSQGCRVEPLTEIFELLSLQELDLKIREVNHIVPSLYSSKGKVK